MDAQQMDMQWVRVSAPQDNILLARFGHTAVTVDANEYWGTELVVMYGGVSPRTSVDDKHTALSDVVVLQADTEAWFSPEVSGEGPGPRAFHCSCVVGRKVYVFGGHVMTYDPDLNKRRKNFFQDLWALDTDTWSWTQIKHSEDAAVPPKRDMACMVHVGYGRLLLFGGRSDSTRALGDLWLFDTDAQEWSLVKVSGPSPPPRKMHSMVLTAGKVVVFGGEKDSGGLLDDLWLLKGLDGVEVPRWTPVKIRPGPQPRFGHGAAVSGSRMALFGGCLDLTTFLSLSRNYVQCNELWLLDTNTFTWVKVEFEGMEVPAERMCHTMTALPGGRALLVGGRGANRIFPDVWWLNVEGELPNPSSTPSSALQSPAGSEPIPIPSPSTPSSTAAGTGTPPQKGGQPSNPATASPGGSSLLHALLLPLKPSRVSSRDEEAGPLDKSATAPSSQGPDVTGERSSPGQWHNGSRVGAEAVGVLQMQPLDVAGRLVADTQQRLRRVADVGSTAMDRLSNTVTSFLPTGLQPRLLTSSTSRGSLKDQPASSSPTSLTAISAKASKHSSSENPAAPSAEATAMEALRIKLGLPLTPRYPTHHPSPLSPRTTAHMHGSLAWLGQQLEAQSSGTPPPLTTAGPAAISPEDETALITSARTYLCTCSSADLPLQHLDVLLRDYKHLAARSLSRQLQTHLTQQHSKLASGSAVCGHSGEQNEHQHAMSATPVDQVPGTVSAASEINVAAVQEEEAASAVRDLQRSECGSETDDDQASSEAATSTLALLQDFEMGRQRFQNISIQELRVADVGALVDEYKTLVQFDEDNVTASTQ